MRKVLVATAALLAAVALGFGVSRLRQPAGPPNLVVIVVDTLRADHLPFHGYPVDTAPFLSRLASRGLVFTRATATSSWTATSTASIFTSLYPFQHGVVTGFVATRRLQKEDPTITLDRIPDEITTLPEVLAAAGYRTFGVADNVNICAAEGFDAGFDRFANFNYESADRVNRQMAEGFSELYDLASDPGERRNRAAELPEWAARLREALGRFLLSCRSYDPEHEEVATDRELLEKLRSLGYVR